MDTYNVMKNNASTGISSFFRKSTKWKNPCKICNFDLMHQCHNGLATSNCTFCYIVCTSTWNITYFVSSQEHVQWKWSWMSSTFQLHGNHRYEGAMLDFNLAYMSYCARRHFPPSHMVPKDPMDSFKRTQTCAMLSQPPLSWEVCHGPRNLPIIMSFRNKNKILVQVLLKEVQSYHLYSIDLFFSNLIR